MKRHAQSPASQARSHRASSAARSLAADTEDDDGQVDYVDLLVSAKKQRKSFGRLRRLLRQSVQMSWRADPKLFVSTVVLQLSAAAVLGAQVLIVQSVLHAILEVTQDSAGVAAVALPIVLLSLVTAFTAVSVSVQANQQRLMGELVMRSSWQQLLDVAGAVGLRLFETAGFYDRLQRVQTNALSRPFQLTQGLVGLLGGLAGCIGLSLAILSLEPLLLPLLLLAGIPLFFTTRRESKLEFEFAVSQTPRMRLRNYLGLLQTGRDEAKEIRAFDLSTTLRGRFDETYGDYLTDLRAHVRRRTRLAALGNLGSAGFLALTLLTLVWLIGRGRVSLPEAGAAIIAIRLLAAQVNMLFKSSQQIFESGLFLDDLAGFMTMRPVAEHEEDGAQAPSGFAELAVEGLEFSYPGSTSPALRDLSLTIRAGEIIALVGENGSGKTTLAKLLAALYEPDSGTIRWDGVDTRTYQRGSLRRSIAVIFQDFVRYQLTARENVGLGRPERMNDEAAVAAAAQQAGATQIIERLPAGYETILSKMFKGGRDLSGGQWQRIALARAFFRDAPFVILDEPSAALDPRAEHDLFASLRELLAGRTVLFISHRFSSVRSADRIYVLDSGEIREQGSHEELMVLDGHYAELFRLQAAAYLDSESAG